MEYLLLFTICLALPIAYVLILTIGQEIVKRIFGIRRSLGEHTYNEMSYPLGGKPETREERRARMHRGHRR